MEFMSSCEPDRVTILFDEKVGSAKTNFHLQLLSPSFITRKLSSRNACFQTALCKIIVIANRVVFCDSFSYSHVPWIAKISKISKIRSDQSASLRHDVESFFYSD